MQSGALKLFVKIKALLVIIFTELFFLIEFFIFHSLLHAILAW